MLSSVLEFSEWCKENEITLFVTYPSIPYFKSYESGHYKNYFDSLMAFYKQHYIATIGSPQDFFFEKNLFYNSEYHLNESGMTTRTNKLIDMMKNIPEIEKFIRKNQIQSKTGSN
jgi:spore coat polysaccharide biosynthesis protein SpsF (cytidylyltransferase family)